MFRKLLSFCLLVLLVLMVIQKRRAGDRERHQRPLTQAQGIDRQQPAEDVFNELPPPISRPVPPPPPGLPEVGLEPLVDPFEETSFVNREETVDLAEVETPAAPEVVEAAPVEIEIVPDVVPPRIEGATVGARAKERRVVISEIMYFPPGRDGSLEDTTLEFIEFQNPSGSDIDLTGYRLDKGVQFEFPAVTLPSGKFLVVAANLAAFEAYYGVEGKVLGDWEGQLSNSGEDVRLVDASGETVDAVSYADQGDWGERRRYTEPVRRNDFGGNGMMFNSRRGRGFVEGAFWEWHSEAAGSGSSLELINPRLTNNAGMNWAPSSAPKGTPGWRNSQDREDIAPLILDVKHTPAVPLPNQKVVISAEVLDEKDSGYSAFVVWRESDRRDRNVFQKTPMAPLGDGQFAATLPGQADHAVIEFYVEATDGKQTRTWPAPTTEGQVANALYQVDQEQPVAGQAFYRLIMTERDSDDFPVDPGSNGPVNLTAILDDGSGPSVRYRCGVRVRGAGSRGHSPPPMRVTLPHDRPWNGKTKLNLNSKYTWLQFIGMKLFEASDLPTPVMIPAQVRRNGVNYTNHNTYDYGAYVHAEPLDGDFAKAHFPEDGQGNMYKKVRPDTSWSYYRGDVSAYEEAGWIKQSNTTENDWTDLDRFFRVLNTAYRDQDYLQQVEEVMNIDVWLRYFAVMALLCNGEGGIANGIDDDYGIYRGVRDTRFVPLPHDLDTILSVGDGSRIRNPHHTLLDFVEDGDRLRPLVYLFERSEIRRRYFEQMASLLQGAFSERAFDRLLDQQLNDWVPARTVQGLKEFMLLRRQYAQQEVLRNLGVVPSPLEPATTQGSLLRPIAKANVAINEVLAVNSAAYEHRGAFPDFIELYNPGDAAVSLGGFSLSDDEAQAAKYVFPEGSEIGPQAYAVVYADDQSADGEWHCGFSLKSEGENVFLRGKPDAEGKRAVVDSIEFGPQIPDHSIGRTLGEIERWSLTKPSPGQPNESVALGDPRAVRINEWLACPGGRYANDFIELCNPLAQPISLGGASLTDDPVNAPTKLVLPSLSFMAPKSLLVFEALGKKAKSRHPCDLPFGLASDHGCLALLGAKGQLIDRVYYHAQRPDEAQGRLPNASDKIERLAEPTPGSPNGITPSTKTSNGALLAGLRVSELMFHAPDDSADFIELVNIAGEVLPLEGVRFSEGVRFVFPAMSLEPSQCVVIVANAEAFAKAHPGCEARIAGDFEGKLANAGETLELRLPSPQGDVIQRFGYKDKWQPSTDAGGFSLEAVDLSAPVESWNHREQWRASKEKGGSPGRLR